MTLLFVINYTFIGIKRDFLFFFSHEFAHSDVCNFLVHSLAKLSKMFDKIINKHTVHYLKTDNTLFKITTRGLLIKTLNVLSIPSMR